MKKDMSKYVKFVISLILIFILISKIDIDDFCQIISGVSIGIVVGSCFIYNASVFLNGVKWHFFLSESSIFKLIIICFKSQFYSTVLPGQLFGEASKIVDWKATGEKIEKVASSVVFDKISSLIGTMLVGVLGLIFSKIQVPIILRCAFLVLTIIMLLAIIVVRFSVVNELILQCFNKIWKLVKYKKLLRKTYFFYKAWYSFAGKGNFIIKSIIVAMGNQFLGSFQVWMIAKGMGINISIWEFFWIVPAVAVVLLLPISFAGLGIREVSFVGLLSLYGVKSEQAVSVSVMMLISQISAAMIGAFMILFARKKPEGKGAI